jgi:hypothetical protein
VKWKAGVFEVMCAALADIQRRDGEQRHACCVCDDVAAKFWGNCFDDGAVGPVSEEFARGFRGAARARVAGASARERASSSKEP